MLWWPTFQIAMRYAVQEPSTNICAAVEDASPRQNAMIAITNAIMAETIRLLIATFVGLALAFVTP